MKKDFITKNKRTSMHNKKAVSMILIVALLATFAFFAKNNVAAETNNINPYQSMYSRVRFNINSKNETVTLTKIQRFLIKKQLHPIRIWVLINSDVTAMFTVQKDWDLPNLGKIISANILSNYKNAVISDEKKSPINTKQLEKDKMIVKTFSSNPGIQITALDFPYGLSFKPLFKTSGVNFAVSDMFYNNKIFSPQLQWDLLHQKTESQPSYAPSYGPHQYPDDSTWLPNYVSTDIRTLRDAGESRYINQETEWYSNSNLSYFHGNYNNATYEQDTVFWRENNDTDCYVLWTPNLDPSNVLSWYSNFPDSYLDSRCKDSSDALNLTVGCTRGIDLQPNTLYYYTVYAKKGNVSFGYELQTDEQPGYYEYSWVDPSLDTFSLKTHVEYPDPAYVPGFYTWHH